MSIIYRYGVSMLSRNSHANAKREELMIDKNTGQILLKQSNGKILSYDSMSRFQESVDRIRQTAERNIVMGKLVAIVPQNLFLPRCISNQDEVLVNETAPLGVISKLVMQLDIDVIDTESTFGDTKNADLVEAEVTFTRNGKETKITMPVVKLSETFIKFDTPADTLLTSIKIVNKDEADNAISQYILQNILLLTV